VQPQILDIQNRQRGRGQDVSGHLGKRRRVTAWKDAAPYPRIERPPNVASDEVEQSTSAVALQGSPQNRAKTSQMSQADVFEHPD
jgi:hypothetical protein